MTSESTVIESATFAFLDIETTGGNSARDRITEIGIRFWQAGEVVGEWQTLLNPETRISPFIENFTGISNEMVADAPLFEEVADELEEQLKGTLTAREFYQQMLWLCKDGKPQPAYFSTLKVFGLKAPFNWQQLQPIKASPEVMRWRQYDLIRWKKMRRA